MRRAAALLPALASPARCGPAATYPCALANLSQLPFCDAGLPLDARVRDLVGRMTLQEKAAYLSTKTTRDADSDRHTEPVPRLGIPPVRIGECLHGVASGNGDADCIGKKCPTSYPSPASLATSFNDTLWNIVGDQIGTEARAMRNAGKTGAGLLCWSPVVNLLRDPRWGRADEAPSEDPLVCGRYGVAYVKGMQGEGPYVKIGSTLKHYGAYGMDSWCSKAPTRPDHECRACGECHSRNDFNSVVSEQDMTDYYDVPFKMSIEQGRARSIMTSENAINGYACGSSPRLNGILRAKFNFTGFFTSDCGGISDVANHMGLDEVHAAAAAVTAGNDLECADQDPNPPNGGLYVRYLAKGVADKLVTQEAVDTAVSNVLRVQMELGEFDDPAKVPHKQIGTDQFDSGAHQAVAREAADQSVVLLQNRGGVLPLPKGATLKVAVIGPHGKSTDRLLGEADYATQNNHVGANSLYAVLGRRPGVTVTYAEGCTFSDYCASSKHVAAAVAAAKGADVVVLALGTTACDRSCKKACECESEGHDRHFIDLPGVQPDLVKQVAAAATGTVIGVLVHAGPLAVEPLIDAADAIIDPHNPGQSGMEATVAVMFGDVNPTGREAATVYPSTYVTAERPDMFDMSLRGANQSGMTYQYYAGAALFEFGHGLSFSNFTYEWSPPPPFSAAEIARGAEVTHTVTVTNAAGPAGAASVLGFVAGDGAARPRKKLFDFARTEVIHPGASAIVTLRSSAAAFAAAGVVRPGEYTLLTGDPAGHAACTFRVTGAEHAVAGA